MDTLIVPSGDTLRTWMGIGEGIFYGDFGIAVMTMFFSGFDSKGAHLSIPQKCAFTLCQMILSQFPNIILSKLIVDCARKVDLKTTSSMHAVFAYWQVHLPHFVPLPHPSWRNNALLRKYRWLEAEVVPVLR